VGVDAGEEKKWGPTKKLTKRAARAATFRKQALDNAKGRAEGTSGRSALHVQKGKGKGKAGGKGKGSGKGKGGGKAGGGGKGGGDPA
jgi:hypothetical protein